MTSLDDNNFTANSDALQGMQTLIVGRLIVVFLLLVSTWIWYSGGFDLSVNSLYAGPMLVFIVAIGLTIVYFLFLRLSRRYDLQLRAQFLIDAVLITWLVWRTGDLSSPYITLYIVLIAIASLYFRPGTTMLASALCSLLFLALAVLTSIGILEPSGVVHETRKIVQIVSFHLVAFLVVGLLASRLSERRFSGQQLAEATKDLANLRALHERIVESIRSGLITTDLGGNIFSFNAAATEITGFRAEEVIGRSITTLFGDISEPIALSLDAASGGTESQPRFEADLTTPDGFAVRIGYNISQLRSEKNEASGLIITFQDLTQIRSMEESVRRKDRLAAVGRVGAGLAHEIRNPLGAMRGAIQVLESVTPPESSQSDLMGIILRESDRLNSIITNFLSYAKPKVGNFVEIDVCEVLGETLTLLKHGPDVRPDHVLTGDFKAAPIFISADSAQLKQVFWNLARNALQAMPDGGRLEVATYTIPSNRVRITFADTGRGMPPEAVEQLFEPFSNSTSGGTGLGLSIVYQIIRDHNGTINVRSIEGEGTVITVELPREHRPVVVAAQNGQAVAETNRLEHLLNVRSERDEISP